MTLQNVKLIIWDLDETFWQGTISEGDIQLIPEYVNFLKDTTDMGIVNSICSKNDYDVVKKHLKNEGLWEYFVFSSIDWNSKGQRVKSIIDSMKLRPANVLFVDDNVQNLEEAKHFCPELMTMFPQEIANLIKEAEISLKKDLQHKRLNQYKQLEEKEEARTEFESNEDFLMSCNIRVDIRYDCENELERIHELIMRSNQLNYTKLRQSKEDLFELIKNHNVKTGYVNVNDKFGDYGIVGFFAVKEDRLIHYAFSCRTLGMKIEQYVYYVLGCPKLEVMGEVVTKLNKTEKPAWINSQVFDDSPETKLLQTGRKKILFKGPCDMSQMYAFLNLEQKAVTEFTYTNDKGISVEGHNHTSQIVTALYASEERKKEIINDADFFDKDMLTTAMRNEKFDFIVLSMLTDGNLGIYRRKETGEEVSFCEKMYSLTDPQNRDKYLKGDVFTSFIQFTNETLEKFESKYEFVDNTDAEKTINNLQKIWEYISEETKLILLLGSEHQFKKKCKESYNNRHLEHANMNRKIQDWASNKNNVVLIPFDKFIRNDADFIDTINHFVKRVYYDLAGDLAEIMADSKKEITVKGKNVLFKESVKQKLRLMKRKILGRLGVK